MNAQTSPRRLALIGLALLASGAVCAEVLVDPPGPTDWRVAPRVELGVQLAGESDLFWRLPDRFSSSVRYDTARHWWEGYVEPGVQASKALGGGWLVRGDFSAVASGTWRRDPYDEGNTSRVTVENAWVGLGFPLGDTGVQGEVSVGAQPVVIGSGMLISNGASNGFARGALKLGPRKAFEASVLAKASRDAWQASLFHLDPNENPDGDSHTRLWGAALTYQVSAEHFAGVAYGEVPESQAPYAKAGPDGGPPEVLNGAREGLQFLHGFIRWPTGSLAGAQTWVHADLALERNRRVDLRAFGWRGQVEALWSGQPWQPRLILGIQSFSGDDPSTPRLERFDPLFYEGSPGAWASGSKASMVFINTNVNALQASLEIKPSPQDVLTLYVAHLRANQLRSPLQFGQATRLEITDGVTSVLSGVTHAHLSDDVFLKYTRAMTRHAYLTLGYSISFPGPGIRRLMPGHTRAWSGWLCNLVLAY